MVRLVFLAAFFISSPFLNGLKANADTCGIDAMIYQAYELQNTHPDSSLQLARTIYNRSVKEDYIPGIAAAFMRMGSIFNMKGNNDSALHYIEQAYTIRQKLMDYNGAANACHVLSYIFIETGKLDDAYEVLLKALRLCEKTSDSLNLAYTYNLLGNLSMRYEETDTALYYYTESLRIARKSDDRETQRFALSGMGKYYYSLDSFKLAMHYYLQALKLHQEVNDYVALANNANNLALCYDHLGEHKRSVYYYQKALLEYDKLGLETEKARTFYNLATIYHNNYLFDSAVIYLNRTIAIARKRSELNLLSAAYEHLSDTYYRQKDYEQAYFFHLAYTAIRDSLFNNEKIASISEMQTRYDTEKKEQQILLLAEQGKTRAAQRNAFIAGSAVLLLGLFVLGFYYRQRKKISHKNEELAQQKIETLLNEQEIQSYNAMIEGQEEERQRIASDLHDRLGSMLSTVKLLFSSLETGDEEVKHKKLGSMVDEACVEVRRISHNLSTGMVKSFGLKAALEDMCEGIGEIINCKLLFYGIKDRLNIRTEIALYRMIQEIVNNILKHARAQNMTIQLNHMESVVNVTIEDDGVGFRPAKRKGAGIGLANLEARAAKLNGTYHIDSTPGKGTISIIEIPLKPEE